MILGSCPYDDCDGPLMIPICDNPPQFEKHECEECGRVIWTRHSRIDPWSMTEAEFLAAYDVDEIAHTIKERVTQ